LQHYKKGGPIPTHVLSMDSSFDMGRFSQEALDAAKNQLATPPILLQGAQSTKARAGSCRDWNRGLCARNPCKFTHTCSSCSSASHTMTDCPQPGPPSSNLSPPPQPGRGGRGGRGRGRQIAGSSSPSSGTATQP
jgi:hypothetical protein